MDVEHHIERQTSKNLLEWQKRLLPFMVAMMVALAVFAAITNAVEAWHVQTHIEKTHEIDLKVIWDSIDKSQVRDPFALARWKTIALLESEAMERRYHQGTAMIMSRVYIIFLAFVTGMVMALVGATFILGKLETSENRLATEGAGWKGALQTSSPGLVLCFLGTALIVCAIFARAELYVYDTDVYLPKLTFDATAPQSGGTEPKSSTDVLNHFKDANPSSK